jgi:hypothetical protein
MELRGKSTTIPADNIELADPGTLDLEIENRPATVQDLLLQRRDGTFLLVKWREKLGG